MTALGTMIENRMSELGVNQSQFAQLCELSESQISLLRSGNRKGAKMQVDTAQRVAQALGIGVDALLAQLATAPATT